MLHYLLTKSMMLLINESLQFIGFNMQGHLSSNLNLLLTKF